MKLLLLIILMLTFSVNVFAGEFDVIKFILSYAEIAGQLVIAFSAFLAISLLIPGEQPDKFLQAAVDFFKKFSRK